MVTTSGFPYDLRIQIHTGIVFFVEKRVRETALNRNSVCNRVVIRRLSLKTPVSLDHARVMENLSTALQPIVIKVLYGIITRHMPWHGGCASRGRRAALQFGKRRYITLKRYNIIIVNDNDPVRCFVNNVRAFVQIWVLRCY